MDQVLIHSSSRVGQSPSPLPVSINHLNSLVRNRLQCSRSPPALAQLMLIGLLAWMLTMSECLCYLSRIPEALTSCRFVVLVSGTLVYGRGDDAEIQKATETAPEEPGVSPVSSLRACWTSFCSTMCRTACWTRAAFHACASHQIRMKSRMTCFA